MKLTYHGHSVVAIDLNDRTKLLFDPFITGNPLTDLVAEEVTADYLFVTHGHSDHIGDMVSIAKRCQATIVSMVEVCHFAKTHGVTKTNGMNLGGQFNFPFGAVKMVPALHSSGLEIDGQTLYLGQAGGFVLQAEGKTIYHAGDTALFSDLALIGAEFTIDVAFLPIGDNFTMGPSDALKAAALLRANTVIPIHYNTFPVIKQNPEEFRSMLPIGVGKVLAVGETIEV